jgi:hypothetical protein
MGKVYKNQTELEIQLTTNQDITGGSAEIRYKKPDATTGHFDAEIDDYTNGVIVYTITSEDDIDQAGEWYFWAHVTFTGGGEANGEPVKITVYNEGK